MKTTVKLITGVLIFLLLLFFVFYKTTATKLSPDYYLSKEESVRSLGAFVKSQYNQNLTDEVKLISLAMETRKNLKDDLTDFNIHLRIENDDLALYLCDKEHHLRFKDLYKTKFIVDYKYFTQEVNCICVSH